jgi:hypothetical protein
MTVDGRSLKAIGIGDVCIELPNGSCGAEECSICAWYGFHPHFGQLAQQSGLFNHLPKRHVHY